MSRSGQPNLRSFRTFIVQTVGGSQIVEGLRSQRDKQTLDDLWHLLAGKVGRHVNGMNPSTLGQYIAFSPGEVDPNSYIWDDEEMILLTPIRSLGNVSDSGLSGRQRLQYMLTAVIVCAIYDLVRHDVYLAHEERRGKQYANT